MLLRINDGNGNGNGNSLVMVVVMIHDLPDLLEPFACAAIEALGCLNRQKKKLN